MNKTDYRLMGSSGTIYRPIRQNVHKSHAPAIVLVVVLVIVLVVIIL